MSNDINNQIIGIREETSSLMFRHVRVEQKKNNNNDNEGEIY